MGKLRQGNISTGFIGSTNPIPLAPLAKQALDKVSSKYPNFEPKEQYPDLTHWIESGRVGPHSHWTPEELLSKRPSYWLDRLLSEEDAEREGPTRSGLFQSLSEATKRDFDWSLGLADAFGGTGQWGVYPWSALIDTWGANGVGRRPISPSIHLA